MDLDPAWTPTGEQIVFHRVQSRLDSVDLYIIASDGAGLRHLSTSQILGGRPDISPDGKQLALESLDGIYIGAISGAGLTRVPGTRVTDRFPKWSPDSRRIAFARTGEGIQLINLDGSGLVRLDSSGRSVVYDDHPTWSPDGTRIAFVGLEGLFVARVDGSEVNLILSGHIFDPAWSR
jgi:TolB protein